MACVSNQEDVQSGRFSEKPIVEREVAFLLLVMKRIQWNYLSILDKMVPDFVFLVTIPLFTKDL